MSTVSAQVKVKPWQLARHGHPRSSYLAKVSAWFPAACAFAKAWALCPPFTAQDCYGCHGLWASAKVWVAWAGSRSGLPPFLLKNKTVQSCSGSARSNLTRNSLKSAWNCQYPKNIRVLSSQKLHLPCVLENLLRCDSGLGKLGAGRSKPECLLSNGMRSTGWPNTPALFPWLSNQVTDPSSLGKSKRLDKEPECLWKIPLVETSVNAIIILLLSRRNSLPFGVLALFGCYHQEVFG